MKKYIFSIILFVGFIFQLFSQQQFVLKSDNLTNNDTVWVFTPSDYHDNNNQAYPAIYLLHGWSGNYHQWNDIINCQEYADKFGFIIICPDGLYDSWYINSPAISNSQFTDFFFQELMPFVTKKFNINLNKVFISGLSMGGHGALYLFEQKPKLFKSAGSLSGVLDFRLSSNKYSINKYLGLKNQIEVQHILDQYSVSGNIQNIASSGKEIIFSCGTEDPFYQINNNFKQKCDSLNIKATYIVSSGGHNYQYWNSAIKHHFIFFKQFLNN